MALGTDTLWNSTTYWSEPAERAFATARRKARWQAFVDRLRGRRADLVPFHEVADPSSLLRESREHPVDDHRTSGTGGVDPKVGDLGIERLPIGHRRRERGADVAVEFLWALLSPRLLRKRECPQQHTITIFTGSGTGLA